MWLWCGCGVVVVWLWCGVWGYGRKMQPFHAECGAVVSVGAVDAVMAGLVRHTAIVGKNCGWCVPLKALEQLICSTVMSGRSFRADFTCLVMCSAPSFVPPHIFSGPSISAVCPCWLTSTSSPPIVVSDGPQFVPRPFVQGCDFCGGHVVKRGICRLPSVDDLSVCFRHPGARRGQLEVFVCPSSDIRGRSLKCHTSA